MAISQDATLDQVSDIPSTDGVNRAAGHRDASEEYHYMNQPLNRLRPIRVAIIGAGIAGIAAVKMFKDTFGDPGTRLKLTIYEKNADVGGTWLENRYPGYAN
jgi:hypothetical protein